MQAGGLVTNFYDTVVEYGRRHGKVDAQIRQALDDVIFVYGSNLSGIHGAGAAKDAFKYWGAFMGEGLGLQGQSYAIPTKDHNINTLPLYVIRFFVRQFIQFAKEYADYEYQVTAIGCGLAGYTPEQIAPMFVGAPAHVHLPFGWRQIISDYETNRKLSKLPF